MRSRFLLCFGFALGLSALTIACDQVPARNAHDTNPTIVHVSRGYGAYTPYVERRPRWNSAIESAPTVRASRDRPRVHIEASPPTPRDRVETWRDRWPVAAHDFDDWARRYPDAAEHLLAWDERFDERAEAFIEWAVGNPYETFDVFLLTRGGWEEDERAMLDRRQGPAVRALLEVIRRSPRAWVELAHYPRGLEWIAAHGDVAASVAQPQAPR
jgi:hypothetical protein